MKTEAEARKCWCPFSRAVAGRKEEGGVRWGESPSNNRISLEPIGVSWLGGCNCIASECMAWRWLPPVEWNESGELKRAEQTGFCGLAGKP